MAKSEMPDASFFKYFWGDNTYTTPSDGGGYREYAGTGYKSCLGAKWPVLGIKVTINPATNYVSAGGRFSDHQGNDEGIDWGNGAFPSGRRCGRISDYTFADFATITDGLSNTFGFGEASVYWQGSSARVDPQCIGATVGIPLNTWKFWRNDRKTFTNDGHWQDSFGFSSEHPGGSQFANLDGSVRFISETISQIPYLAAGSVDAGEAQSNCDFYYGIGCPYFPLFCVFRGFICVALCRSVSTPTRLTNQFTKIQTCSRAMQHSKRYLHRKN